MKIDDLKTKIKEDIYLLKKIDYFQEETKEMICKNKKEIAIAEKELKIKLINLKKKYNIIYDKNERKEEEINELNSQLERLKNILLNDKFDKKYIDTEMIIEEVSENKSNYSSFFINNSLRNDSKNFDESYKEKNLSPHVLKNKIKFNENIKNPERQLSNKERKYKKMEINSIPKPIKYRAKSSNSLNHFNNKNPQKE